MLKGCGFIPLVVFCPVFPKNADPERSAGDPDKHGGHTGRRAAPHSGGVPCQSAHHDDRGAHAFPVPSACTVLHPTGDTQPPVRMLPLLTRVCSTCMCVGDPFIFRLLERLNQGSPTFLKPRAASWVPSHVKGSIYR